MNKGMVRCQECGKWYFNWRKLTRHLIKEHGYTISIEEDLGIVEEATKEVGDGS